MDYYVSKVREIYFDDKEKWHYVLKNSKNLLLLQKGKTDKKGNNGESLCNNFVYAVKFKSCIMKSNSEEFSFMREVERIELKFHDELKKI